MRDVSGLTSPRTYPAASAGVKVLIQMTKARRF